jgi:hypothetical protein
MVHSGYNLTVEFTEVVGLVVFVRPYDLSYFWLGTVILADFARIGLLFLGGGGIST